MPARKLIKPILVLALILRVWFTFSSSYIHPDEHLQGPQVVAHELFNLAAQEPWEFRTDHPIRSFVPLWLFYGLPLNLIPGSLNPSLSLHFIRVMMAFLTWVFGDMAIDRLTDVDTGNPQIALLFSASSYVTWTYQSHTFSNSFETILVLWFLVIVHEFEYTRRDPIDKHMDCFLLALIVTVGVFNRPTFLFWILIPSLSLLQFWARHPWSFSTFVLTLTLAFSFCISLDTMVYHSDEWVIAPLNNLKYNSQTSNLALHGEHPWYNHLISSIPQLLGPGILFLRPKLTSLPLQSALGGLLMLSLVPHQEARFLLPIVPLLCTCMDGRNFGERTAKVLLGLWVVFNVVLGFLMGVFHQGGVIPANLWLGSHAQASTIIWWKTYTPPLWLMDQTSDSVSYATVEDGEEAISKVLESASNMTKVVDMMGSSPEKVAEVINSAKSKIYLVAPHAAKHQQFTNSKPLEWSHTSHLNLDLFNIEDLSTFTPGLGIWLL